MRGEATSGCDREEMHVEGEIGDSDENHGREEMGPREGICCAEVRLSRDEIKERGNAI